MAGASKALLESVYRANMELAESGLVVGTFGNVSGVDRDAGVIAIKPSGVPYSDLSPAHMVPVSLETGEVIGSDLRPSSDTPTHLVLYRAFPCGGIVHTHSEHATTLAQAGLPIRCTGTTHADHFRGDVPVSRALTREEVDGEYEKNTGVAIVDTFQTAGISPEEVQAVLVLHHGPFAWGRDAHEAVEHAAMAEYLARMEVRVRLLTQGKGGPESFLIDRHYLRKHGKGAYYGQR